MPAFNCSKTPEELKNKMLRMADLADHMRTSESFSGLCRSFITQIMKMKE